MHQASPPLQESHRWRLLQRFLQSSPLILVGSITTGSANAQVADIPSASQATAPQPQLLQSELESHSTPALTAAPTAPESFVGPETTRLAATESSAVGHQPSVEAIAQPIFSKSLRSQPTLPPTDLSTSAINHITPPATIPSIPERRPNEVSQPPEVESISTSSTSSDSTKLSSPHNLDSPEIRRTSTPSESLFISQVSNPAQLNPSSVPQNVIPSDLPTPRQPPPIQPAAPQDNPQFTRPTQEEVSENCSGEIVVETVDFLGVLHPMIGGLEQLQDQIRQDLINPEHQPVSCETLIQVTSRINAHYATRGYSTSGARVVIASDTTPETPASRPITIRIFEGVLEDGDGDGRPIEIIPVRAEETASGDIELIPTDNHRLSLEYVRSRLALATGTPLNIRRLEEALQFLQLDPLIERVSATLSERPTPGASALTVRVEEADPFRVSLTTDNNRSPSVGSSQRGIEISHGNVLGLGDRLSVGYSNTDGSNGLNASYTIPLNPNNGTLALSYGTSSSSVIEPPFDALDIESTSQTYDLTYRQPIIRRICRPSRSDNPNCSYDAEEANLAQSQPQSPIFEEFAVGLTASVRDSQTFLLNEPFSLSLGTEADGRSRVSALRFFQEWTQQSDRSVFAVRSQFNIGLNVLGATVQESDKNGEIPDSRFVSWQGQAQLVQVLNSREDVHRDTLLTLRANAQLADQFMLSSEQFAIGGAGTVRGYRQDTLQSDNGIFASAELQFPVVRVPGWDGTFYLVPFVDAGIGWHNGDRPDPNPGALASMGIGLQWQMRDPNITARLDWGIPLVSIEGRRDRTWQENGIHFSISFGL